MSGPGVSAGPPGPTAGRDLILPQIRWVAVLVIPILASAFLMLYLGPEVTRDYFAWPIRPRMSAMMLGATYFTGVVYFATILGCRHWHQVRLGLLPVALFATLLGVATLLHWEKFTHANPQFWLWAVLYGTLPVLLVAVWVHNERHARPLPAVAGEVHLGVGARALLAALGAGLALLSAVLFLAPQLAVAQWPWTLSPLTARVTAAELGLFGFFALEVAWVARWSEVRSLLLPQLVSPLLFLGCIAASWGDFTPGSPATWAFVLFVVVVFAVGFPALYFPTEARRRRRLAEAGG